MPRKPKRTQLSDRHRLVGSRLRWRCDPTLFTFKTTADMSDSPIKLIGQQRALEALELGLKLRSDGHNIFVCGGVGSGRSTVVRRMLADLKPEDVVLDDLVYVQNFIDHDSPCRLIFQAGQGCAFKAGVTEFISGLAKDIPLLFESVEYGRQRTVTLEKAAAMLGALHPTGALSGALTATDGAAGTVAATDGVAGRVDLRGTLTGSVKLEDGIISDVAASESLAGGMKNG